MISQDQCVKYLHDWNRADKAIACRHLSKADEAMHECARDRLEDLLFTARPESLPGAGCLVQRGARAFAGAITFELQHALLSIGGRLRQGKSLLADVVELRRAIAAIEVDTGGDLDVIDADYKTDVLAMLHRALGFVTRLRMV